MSIYRHKDLGAYLGLDLPTSRPTPAYHPTSSADGGYQTITPLSLRRTQPSPTTLRRTPLSPTTLRRTPPSPTALRRTPLSPTTLRRTPPSPLCARRYEPAPDYCTAPPSPSAPVPLTRRLLQPLTAWKRNVSMSSPFSIGRSSLFSTTYSDSFDSLLSPSSSHGRAASRSTSLAEICQVLPHLYLSGAHAVSPKSVRELSLTCVINITTEIPRQSFVGVEYVHLQVNDHPDERIDGYFSYCADRIREHRQRGGRTLVHCVAGRSRSVSLVLAYLMKYENMRLLDAYGHVKGKRAIIAPNLGFWQQLVRFESSLYGFNTVKMVRSTRFGLIPDVYERQYSDLIW